MLARSSVEVLLLPIIIIITLMIIMMKLMIKFQKRVLHKDIKKGVKIKNKKQKK